MTVEFPLKIFAYQAPSNLQSPLAQHPCQTPIVDSQEMRALRREKGARAHNSKRRSGRLETKAGWNFPKVSKLITTGSESLYGYSNSDA